MKNSLQESRSFIGGEFFVHSLSFGFSLVDYQKQSTRFSFTKSGSNTKTCNSLATCPWREGVS
jgi:hypothetical protein